MKNSKKLAGITERVLPSGKITFQAYLGKDADGKPHFKNFADRNEAETHLEKLAVAKANEGQALWSLTPDERTEAKRCLKMLQPYGATLTNAVSNYIQTVGKYRNAPTVEKMTAKLLARCVENHRRPQTIKDLRIRMQRFSAVFGKRQLSSITIQELQKFLDVPGLAPRTRVNAATKISQLYNFAIRNGWCDANLVDRIERPTMQSAEVEIFTINEARELLETAPEVGLLPYIAIGLFAGIRREELGRLDWSAIKLSERAIVIGSEVAKKRSRRTVTINDTLLAWLAPYIKSSGKVTPTGLRYRLLKLVEKSKVQWKSNGLRHSFGSYHLAKFQDTAKTASEMGHANSMIVHDHYKAVVLKSDAERFWDLRPDGVAEGKVVPMVRRAKTG